MASDRFDMSGRGRSTPFERPGSDIRKMGYLKKLKTHKWKYFVLRSTSSSGPARLEYYDSEKKFRNGQLPKRSIQLHTLLNINKRSDSKHKYAIALYTKDDCFSVMAEEESSQEEWYGLLLDYQCEYLREGDNRREHYEHVWQVTIQQKGLGATKSLRGNFRLCLSSQSLSLVRVNSEKPQVSFQLATVRTLAHNDNLFRMEVGSWAPTGAGELWMHVEDSVIAQSMHEAILDCMKAATTTSSFDETDTGRFDRRADSTHSMAYPHRQQSQDFRERAVSESHTQSPRRVRAKPLEDQVPRRPVSNVYPSNRSSGLPGDTISPGTSPHLHMDLLNGPHRFRSDSAGSRASHTSAHALAEDLSPMDFHLPLSHPGPTSESTSQVIDEEDDSYLMHDFVAHDFGSSIPSSPAEAKMLLEDTSQTSQYMDMQPGNTTPPTATSTGYVPMTIGNQSTPHDMSPVATVDSDPYMQMGPGGGAPRMASEPIPIKQYMDMGPHSSHLPTVREAGSNEGYLPMTPNSGQSPIDSSHLRPDPSVCMISEDANQIPQRTYSLGSRPLPKSTARVPSIHDPVPIRCGIMDQDGRSCSAPHLIAHRGRGLNVESPTPSASPLSMSFKSESSYRSDDSDSFMELDFHRPRTASDSYSYRPRASSFGKPPMQSLQGHRPRSSSYGQSARSVKMKLGARLGSFESVRTTSQELLHKSSIDSLSHRGSRDSLRVSSNESLRKLSEELRTKTNLWNTDYIDMSLDKRKTPSPQPPGRMKENGYMDMTLGSRTTSPSRSKSAHDSGSTSKSQSSEKLHQSGHGEDTYINIDPPEKAASSPTTAYINLDPQDHGSHGHSRQSSGQSHNRSPDPSGQKYVNIDPHDHGSHGHSRQSSSGHSRSPDPSSQKYGDPHDHGSHGHSRQSSLGHSHSRSPDPSSQKRSSEKEKQKAPVGDDSLYVMYEPSTKSGGSSGHSSEEMQHPVTLRSSGGSSDSLKKKFRHSTSLEKSKSKSSSGREHRRKSSGASSKRKSQAGEPTRDFEKGLHGSKSEKGETGVQGDYIEFAPAEKSSGKYAGSLGKTEKKSKPVRVESEYIGFEPGVVGPGPAVVRPQPVKSLIAPGKKTDAASEREVSKSKDSRILTPPAGVSKTAMSSEESDYVLSSPIGSSQTSFSKVGSHASDPKHDQTSPQTASAPKTSPIVPKSADSAYFNVNMSKRSEKKDTDGSSVDPPTANAQKSGTLPGSVGQTKAESATVTVEKMNPKAEAKFETSAMLSSGPTAIRQVGRVKHYSANAGSSSVQNSGIGGVAMKTSSEAVAGEPSQEDAMMSALARPGSTPCMLTLDEGAKKPVPTGSTTLNVDPNPRSRHSISDLSAYEQMTFPSNTLSTSSSQQQSLTSSQKVLNYASLDLGSSETVGDGDPNLRSPRTRSRHMSSAEDKGEPPLSYAQIDFEKSETLKAAADAAAAGNKDVKFTL